jgi:uncharacterized membrane protein
MSTHPIVVFLRVLGITMLVFSWVPVFNPEIEVYWGKGRSANRALMSRKSKLAFAIAMTGWCLGVFGVNQNWAVGLFMLGFVFGVAFAGKDEDEHVARTGVPIRKAATSGEIWMGLFAVDAVLLIITLYAAIRDHFRPPVTEEQRIVHAMGSRLLALFSVGAVVLYLTRPGNTPSPK